VEKNIVITSVIFGVPFGTPLNAIEKEIKMAKNQLLIQEDYNSRTTRVTNFVYMVETREFSTLGALASNFSIYLTRTEVASS
jgi:hypothetical protein